MNDVYSMWKYINNDNYDEPTFGSEISLAFSRATSLRGRCTDSIVGAPPLPVADVRCLRCEAERRAEESTWRPLLEWGWMGDRLDKDVI